MLKLADFPKKKKKKTFSSKNYLTSLKFLCTVKKYLCTLVYTGAHREDHWSKCFKKFFYNFVMFLLVKLLNAALKLL